ILDRHKVLFSRISENVGKGKPTSLRQAAIEMGYSESYADSGHLQQTRSWEVQRDQILTPEKLLKVHNEGLEATRKINKIVGRDEEGHPEYELVGIEDYATRHKYLDSAYKLRGNYDNTSTIKHEFGHLSDGELEAELSGVISRLSQGLAALERTKKKNNK
ncbi:hypothetical protein HY469_02195, partial [Candidatus Roizmanbacteria bacterium]|nr:hypothetical protein [Candidatus Roizmanbacteria bacterium]